ncbi:MAG: UDP-N-acetylmuramate--L-alanine ligase [Patescibacteria group bacterium]
MKIHFIGIGGIGVSALAKYYLAKGHDVSGCDLASSEITEQLSQMGAKIRIGPPQDACFASNMQEMIYSPAVTKDHPELQKAYKIQDTRYKIQVLSYPQALGELTKIHYTIAISGTHGKSTTTSMIALVLLKAGLDPSVIVGTKLKEFGNSNCRVGEGRKYVINGKPILVIEADEHFASFLNYWPQMIVLTTIEADHLDYYRNLGNIIKTFRKYIAHLPPDGIIIANKDDKNTKEILTKRAEIKNKVRVQTYSLRQPEAKELRKILKVPGEHNVANALAALATARALHVPDRTSFKALSEFKGTWRRFEIFRLEKPVPYTLVSDYGHHPTKVRVTVEAARSKWPKKQIWLVYQPHQYARTYYLWKDFVKVLAKAPVDKLILTDIYDVPGRENLSLKKKVSSDKLANAIQHTKYKIPNTILYILSLDATKKYLNENLKGGEIVMVMGAGDIYNLTLQLTQSTLKLPLTPLSKAEKTSLKNRGVRARRAPSLSRGE